MGIKLITQAFCELYREKISRLGFFNTCYFMHVLAGNFNVMGVCLYMLSFVKQPAINKKYLTG